MARGGAELSVRLEGIRMMRTVQLSLTDTAFAAALRDALSRSGPWRAATVDRPDFTVPSVVVVDETSFARLPLPLPHPERVVLITSPDPHLLAQAWDARLVSVVSNEDSIATVLLAIMAAALRLPASRHSTSQSDPASSAISPKTVVVPAPISSELQTPRCKRCKSR
jgi:hypothetical protein